MINERFRDRERGYNLVEVLIAMALLGTVLMSIMGLFYYGRRNVYSGKEMTEATALGTHVLEDINTMTKAALIAAFALPTNIAGTTINAPLGGGTYAGSFERDTQNITTTTDPNGFMARWQGEMVADNKFQNGKITIIFTPDKDPVNGANPQLGTSSVVRVRVFVTWGEAVRQRQVVLDSVKVDHSAGT